MEHITEPTTKQDFYFKSHGETKTGLQYTKFNHPDVQHRYSSVVNGNSTFTIKPQSCGNPSKLIQSFDDWITAIYWSLGVEPRVFLKVNNPLVFKNIDEANKFIDNVFVMIDKHGYDCYVRSLVLGVHYFNKLPKGFIEVRKNEKFYHYVFNPETLEFSKYDFEPIYNKYFDSQKNIHLYNFETCEVNENLANKCFVKKTLE